jgi:hypothetical protein
VYGRRSTEALGSTWRERHAILASSAVPRGGQVATNHAQNARAGWSLPLQFPSFGDAATYEQLGRTCASALQGGGNSLFDACYNPLRPPGAALLMAAPYLITRDPVDAGYVALSLNVAFFALTVVAMARMLLGDRALLSALPARRMMLGTLVFCALLIDLVSHIPVRLTDLPSLSLFLSAMAVGYATLAGDSKPAIRRWRYGLVGILAAAASLLKVTWLPFSLVLLVVLLTIDSQTGVGERIRCAGAFLLGFSPVALVFANVWAHTGDIWFYDRAFWRAHFTYPGREMGVETVIYTVPRPDAYLTHVTTPISHPTLWVLHLYSGVFHFEWAVYHGRAWRARLWEISSFELAAAWLLVFAYLALTAWEARKGPVSLRLLNATSLGISLITAVARHTEARYYALPRAVLWVTLACLLLGWCRHILGRAAPLLPSGIPLRRRAKGRGRVGV